MSAPTARCGGATALRPVTTELSAPIVLMFYLLARFWAAGAVIGSKLYVAGGGVSPTSSMSTLEADAWTAAVFEEGKAVSVNKRELQPIFEALPESLPDRDKIRRNLNRAIAKYLDNELVAAQDNIDNAARCIDLIDYAQSAQRDASASVSSVEAPRLTCLAGVALMVTSVVCSWLSL